MIQKSSKHRTSHVQSHCNSLILHQYGSKQQSSILPQLSLSLHLLKSTAARFPTCARIQTVRILRDATAITCPTRFLQSNIGMPLLVILMEIKFILLAICRKSRLWHLWLSCNQAQWTYEQSFGLRPPPPLPLSIRIPIIFLSSTLAEINISLSINFLPSQRLRTQVFRTIDFLGLVTSGSIKSAHQAQASRQAINNQTIGPPCKSFHYRS